MNNKNFYEDEMIQQIEEERLRQIKIEEILSVCPNPSNLNNIEDIEEKLKEMSKRLSTFEEYVKLLEEYLNVH